MLLLGFLMTCQSKDPGTEPDKITGVDRELTNWKNEIIYHVVQRSFYDSDGDLHGDLNGFIKKLDYLKSLGVTTILFTPLYESGFYHNYFPTDYEKIDQEYGTMQDYFSFVKAVHQKGMKFLMDMETQYAQSGHKWFEDSYQKPDSEFSDFIYYSDSANEYPEQIFMPSRSPLHHFNAWPDTTHNIVFLDLNNEKVKDWMLNFYSFWVDPNQDGNFEDGVDGFRIDHIMDDLDNKGLFVNMYKDFWAPIFTKCRSINPDIFVVGEQSDWNEYGDRMVAESGADAAFNFQLLFALSGEEGTHDMYKESEVSEKKLDLDRIHRVVQESIKRFSGKTYTVNFLENHDTKRWASVVDQNEGLMRNAAILNVLLPGVPSIYYGQELGLTGVVQEWGSDANHLPVREAFPWTINPDEPGTALFYKNTGEWWDLSFHNSEVLKDLALSTQQKDPGSLWNHYKKLIEIRKQYGAVRLGDYQPVQLEDPYLMAFVRENEEEKILVVLNLNEEERAVDLKEKLEGQLSSIYHSQFKMEGESLNLGGYGYGIFQIL